ncbi:GntR family transcriptional regulator [Halomonas sp. McH1-25]|uniref:GntR family transcriptional regulator n=1 Tax=unclassified Halomonas TaxID=2609666 RepID=UPI001EF543DC|nr:MULTISPECIES: GntR family transcriptional regulator [unclassified Halomonas]MCG7599816.1 GntR family transcriptional regulator [Halomonas sp. McH1-25]MCP1341711.1 GntR family transcriptional regulator [Halomonas sp. FL8]MCP1359869.1 GntR family transcriptional regulator [Halomonas sp. BBD45]MCP1367511.1 GntR family transcriptional regulator [Halomonas sp. BBD48]
MKPSNAQRLRDALENDILNGRRAPGERLDPEALGQEFNVSRTPVREAIQQLVASGLVIVQPKKGTFVAQVGIDRLIEMFEVMAELEGMCGRLAARRISPQELIELQGALVRCEQAAQNGDTDEYYYENEAFHSCIYAASHNAFLADEARQLKMRLKPYRRLQLKVRHRMQSSLEEHRRIVAAIEAGDTEAAEQALRSHVLVQGERFSDLVASVKDLNRAREPEWS